MRRIKAEDAIPQRGSRCVLIAPPVYESEGVDYGQPVLPGLLYFATVVAAMKCGVTLVDLQHLRTREKLLDALEDIEEAEYYGISNVAYTTFVSSLDIATKLQQRNPETQIVIGGCHIGLLPRHIALPDGLEFYYGFFPFQHKGVSLKSTPLRYDLWPKSNRARYSFLFDVGCNYRCTFCVHPRQVLRDEQVVQVELAWAIQNDILTHPFHLGTYDLGLCIKHCTHALETLATVDTVFQSQTRPDTFVLVDDKHLQLLKKAGLASLSLGMEAIDSEQLVRHRKTRDPEKWVKDTVTCLERLNNAGILTKINIIIFDGSTQRTLDSLYEFLNKHRHLITGISASPLMAFPGTSLYSNSRRAELETNQEQYFSARHIFPVHLSDSLSYDDALSFCKSIADEFTTDAYRCMATSFYSEGVEELFST